MCPGDAPVAGGVRRWRPGACTCGMDVPCSGAGGRSAPQMVLNNQIASRPRGKASREWQTGKPSRNSRAGASWRAEQKLVLGGNPP